MPTLRQLEYLVAVAETLHFRRAADRVHTTQPTLSEQIKALEERLGVVLVERTQKKVLLTPVGEEVVKIARRMLTDASEIRSLASYSRSGFRGVFKLGVPDTVGPYLLPRLIPSLQEQYPDLRFYVREVVPSRLVNDLLEGRYDLVVSFLPNSSAGVHAEPLVEEKLHLSVGKEHKFVSEGDWQMSDLRGEDVLTLSEGHQLHDAVRGICQNVGARLRIDYEGTSLDTLREMVAIDLGVTFLPGFYVDAIARLDNNIRIVDLPGEVLSRQIGMFWRDGSVTSSRYSELAAAFRKAIGSAFPGYKVLGD